MTGRPIEYIDRLLAPLRPVAAGVHGAELRVAADGEITRVAESLDTVVSEAVNEIKGMDAGVAIESKGRAIAVHCRLAPTGGPRLQAALDRILKGSSDHLMVCPGRKVLEIMPRRISKGAALERNLDLHRFRGRRPIMIGDDASDQSTLDAARRRGGLGLRVAGEHFDQATADFDSPTAVRAWLAALAERQEGAKRPWNGREIAR